jgi:hypothetical protein
MSCPICTEEYTQATRKKLICLYCSYEACNKCIKKYFLTTMNEPNCMNCQKIWNKEYIDENFSKNFLKTEYKKHRENILYEREQCLIPETLQLMDINKEQKMNCQLLLNQYIEEKNKLLENLKELNKNIINVRHQIYKLENNEISTLNDIEMNEKKPFIKKCNSENCHGYINHKGHCSLCNLIICMMCHENKTENHECIESNIEAINLIKKETKTCPKCNVNIYKIEGCNQMWCTQCHTAFNWKSGLIINQQIHNPHYYEYLQLNKIKINQQCQENELPSVFNINQLNIDNLCKKKLLYIHRMIYHIINEELPKYTVNEDSLFTRNINNRLLFIKNRISESKFKQYLINHENQIEKKKAFRDLYQMFINTMIVLFQEYMNDLIFDLFYEKYINLIEYVNSHVRKICKRFNIITYIYDHNLNPIRYY